MGISSFVTPGKGFFGAATYLMNCKEVTAELAGKGRGPRGMVGGSGPDARLGISARRLGLGVQESTGVKVGFSQLRLRIDCMYSQKNFGLAGAVLYFPGWVAVLIRCDRRISSNAMHFAF